MCFSVNVLVSWHETMAGECTVQQNVLCEYTEDGCSVSPKYLRSPTQLRTRHVGGILMDGSWLVSCLLVLTAYLAMNRNNTTN